VSREPELNLAIDSRLENVPLLSQAIRGACASLGLPEQALGEVELCVVEAVTNCIEHGYANQPGHSIRVRVAAEEEGLVITLMDQGEPIPENRLPPPPEPEVPEDPHLLAEGGRGIFLLFAMMDRVEYERSAEGNRLTLVKLYPPAEDEHLDS
jgi:serine/threonine-protein kinase RsbW